MKILVCNAGSTSLKFKIYEMPEETVLCESRIERVGSTDDAVFHYRNVIRNKEKIVLEKQCIAGYSEGIEQFLKYALNPEEGVLEKIDEVERAGFKTVLAGKYSGIHELTEEVLEAMEEFRVVAPAHNGPYLEAVRAIRSVLPQAKMIGAFETAFHESIPLSRRMYGVPYEWYEKYGIRKYGYHGASHSYIAEEIERMEGKSRKIISCHLGGSGSVCAISDGKSVDSSFGLSLQNGIIHSNRSGDVDPYIVTYLMNKGLTMEEIYRGFDKKGGLLGISGVSSDLRYVADAADQGSERAQLAIETYVEGIVHYIGAYYVELGGLDDLVFTGGIGENSDVIRKMVLDRIAVTGAVIDAEKNSGVIKENTKISSEDSKVNVWVIPANEELGVARKTFHYN